MIGVLVAVAFVIPQAPVSVRQGTAPPTLDRQSQSGGCTGMPEPQKQRCIEEAQARTGSGGQKPDQAIPSSSTSRTERGSGVEAVQSGAQRLPPWGSRSVNA